MVVERTRAVEAPKAPHWSQVVAVVFGAVVLFFFMGLVVASMFGMEVPCGGRFPVVVVLALGSALATAFIGGSAVLKGHITIPRLGQRPFLFAVGGGIGVFVIVLVFGNALYSNSANGCSDVINNVRLRGRILDVDSRAIVDAQVTVEGHSFLARSEPTGDFEGRLGSVKRGDYIRIRFTHAQFNSETRTLAVNDSQLLLNDVRLVRFVK